MLKTYNLGPKSLLLSLGPQRAKQNLNYCDLNIVVINRYNHLLVQMYLKDLSAFKSS